MEEKNGSATKPKMSEPVGKFFKKLFITEKSVMNSLM